MAKFDSDSWIGDLERALGSLVESVTASRWGVPPLTNKQYRALGALANVNPNARAIFADYWPKLHVGSNDVVDLLSKHPSIRPNTTGVGQDTATFGVMPSTGFRIELDKFALYLTRTAVKRGCRETADLVARLLALSAKRLVPGYEVAVFRGLTMSGEVEIVPGLEIISYQRAAERGLVRHEPPLPEDSPPDYVGMGALVLVREMTWGPCFISPAKTSSRDHKSCKPVPIFRFPKCGWNIVFDLLSVLTSHRIQVMSVLYCAPEFTDLNPQFGPLSRVGFLQDDRWSKEELAPEHVSELKDLLLKWSRFKGNRDTIELAVSRLASSINRDRGRFRLQDRILDTAIALEAMYKLDSPEISYKLRVRAGHLLADDADARLKIADKLKEFYSVRSGTVHGPRGRKKKKRDPRETVENGSDIAWKTLQTVLDLGDLPNWDKLVMS